MRAISAIGSAMALIGLSACGGSGSGSMPSPAPIPAPSPTPTPPPPPTPPVVNYNTTEFRDSTGGSFHGALTAYQAGANGSGITVGVVDSGISNKSGEFDGRISTHSADFAGNSDYEDVTGHGTAVSAVIAAGRNDQRVMGMAWGATIMALRTDDQSDCDADGCTHSTTSIANAIDHAREKGARVINVSLGGGVAPNYLLQAVRRATQAGIIIVISAGNNEAGEAPLVAPDGLAQSFANATYSNGLVIIATSVNDNDTVSGFSAGVQGFENLSLSALGNRVRAFDHTGAEFLYSGTSFAAPQIAGAAALLADAFPNLSSKQIVDLLLSKARDVGAPGADARYGAGILDVAAAFAPVGGLTLAGTAIPLASVTPSALSVPMGDATSTAFDAVALDDYRRAYRVDLTPDFERPANRRSFISALGVSQRNVNFGTAALGLSLNVRQAGENVSTRDPLAFTQSDEDRTRLLSGTLDARLSSNARVIFGLRAGITSLERRLSNRPSPSFLMADHGFETDHAEMRVSSAVAISQEAMPGLTVTGGFERGDMAAASHRRAMSDASTWRDTPYRAASLSVGHNRDAFGIMAGATILDEKASMLGSRLSPNYGAQSARSLFARIGTHMTLPGGLSLTANWQRGWTDAAPGGALREGGRLVSQSWSLDVARQNLFSRGDIIGLRVSQPLRVIASRFNLTLPQSWDWEQEMATDKSVPLNLVPRGRQQDYEFSYGQPLGSGWLGANLFLREQGGNIAAMPDEVGMALRWSVGF